MSPAADAPPAAPAPGRVRLVPIEEGTAEAIRLLEAHRREVHGPEEAWQRAVLDEQLELARGRALPGALWVGPKDEAIGLAVWDRTTGAGLRLSAFLEPGYRTPTLLATFLSAIDTTFRIRVLDPPVAGFAERELADLLSPLGFRPVRRVDMVYPLDRELPSERAVPPGIEVRCLRGEDAPGLGALLDSAYADNPTDREIFRQQPDSATDARLAVDDLLEGRVGEWLSDASFGAFDGADPVAATLVTDLRGPLIAEVMVAPSHRRQGLARTLLARSLGALRARGAGEPRLVVTVENRRAATLYESVGFLRRPETEGALWVRSN